MLTALGRVAKSIVATLAREPATKQQLWARLFLVLVSFVAFLLFLHASQPLSTIGPALSPTGFQAVKRASYRVIFRGENARPVVIGLRDERGDLVSTIATFDPDTPGLGTARWKIIKSSISGPASLAAEGEPAEGFELHRLNKRAPQRAWQAGFAFVLVTALCLFSLRQRVAVQTVLLGLGYFLFLLPWTLPSYYSLAADNHYYALTSLSLLHEGNWNLDEFGGDGAVMLRGDYRVRQGQGGHWFNLYPPGTSLLTLPIAVLGEWLNDENPDVFSRAEIVSDLAAKIFSTVSVMLLFLVAFILTARSAVACCIALIFAFATPQLGTHGGGLWSHNTSVLCALAALLLWVWRNGKLAPWAALPLMFGFACRPTMMLATAIFGGALLLRAWRKFFLYALLAALGLGAFTLHSKNLWGTALPPYYTGMASAEDSAGLSAYLGTLVSPNRGLFVLCPILLFSLIGIGGSWRRQQRQTVYLAASAVCLAEWIVASGNPMWWGGHCYGPRLLCALLPFAIVLLIPAWETIERSAWRQPALVFALLACAWGLFVQTQALTNPLVYEWNAKPNIDFSPDRLWSWRDWQVLAR